MRAIVTGATGFVGQNIVNELLKNSIEVIAVDVNVDHVPTEWNDKVICVKLNIFDENEYHVLAQYEAEMVFHLAWAATSGNMRGDISLQLDNAKYACKLMEFLAQNGCKRFIFAGSIMEYEAMEYIAADNSNPSLGMIYSTAKLTADFMLKTLANSLQIEYVNVLISNIYGAGERSARFLNTMLRKMLNNEDIDLTHCNQLYDFIYVTDAARAIVASGLNGKSMNTYYIGNKEAYPLRKFVEEMMEITKSDSKLYYGKVPYNNALLTYKEFDTSKVIDELKVSYELSFPEGVNKTLDWMREKSL